MLELGDPELELVPVAARDEAELAEEVGEPLPRRLAYAQRVAAPARRRVVDERPRLLHAETDRGEDTVDGIRLVAVSGVHAASPDGAACGARASPPARHP